LDVYTSVHFPVEKLIFKTSLVLYHL